MEFVLKFNVDQVNMVIKGLECLRDSSNNTIQYVMQQVQSQAAQPPTPAVVTDSAPASEAA